MRILDFINVSYMLVYGGMKMKKKINAAVYTKGKFGKGWRERLDEDNPFLYSHGRYPTKIKVEDLPEDYIEIHSRVIWYMKGYIKTSGIVDMAYKRAPFNHMFKDDYLYISYNEKLRKERDSFGFEDYVNDDICVCGWDIVDIVLAAELYSDYDTTDIRRQIEEKRIWFKEEYRDFYDLEVKFDEDIFEHFRNSGYIPDRLFAAYDIIERRKALKLEL